MFKRTLLAQTRALSSSSRAFIVSAPPRPSTVVAPALRRWMPAPPRITPRTRFYSTEAKEATEEKKEPPKAPEEETKEAKDTKEAAEANEAKTEGGVKAPEEAIMKDLKQLSEEIEAITKELEKERTSARDYKDKFTRMVADYLNLQDRTERDKKQAREFAIQKFAKDLVDSVDNLDRALMAVPEEAKDEERNKDLMDLYKGLQMTEEILLSTMRKHGLQKIDPLGEPFDPTFHEATFTAPVEGKEPNTVFHVQQTGFTLNGRTIRAAKVGVVAAKKE